MTTCLIFGGNGFIGSHLTEGLIKKGYDVRVFDNFKFGTTNLDAVMDKIDIMKGNFFNETDVCNALKNVDYVFHYLSTTTPATATRDPIYDIESNIIGSIKMFQNAVKNNIKKIIFPSSGGTIYGETAGRRIQETDSVNPVNPYAISKFAIEKYLYYFNYAYGLDYMIFRYSNPYGERQNPLGNQGVIPIFLNKIKHGERPVIYGDGSMIRDYIYIKDAVDATIAVFEKKTGEKIFNVGSGESISLNELIDIMSQVVGQKIIPKFVESPHHYIRKIVLDISRIEKEVDWKPTTSLQEGIRRTWQWIDRCF